MAAPSEENGRISRTTSKPLGIRFVEYIRKSNIGFRTYRSIVLVLTFFAYASYHATRKTTSIVKSVLDPEASDLGHSILISSYLKHGWAPFDNPDGTSLLGEIDVAFLSTYSLGMYFAGHLGDRSNLRIFLTVGMIGTGIFTSLFGAGYWLNIHSFYYYLGIQVLAGVMQSTGWPSVVALIGNWFGKSQRGLIMGIWNAHTSVGNITGSLIASALLAYGWGWSFVVPGLLIIIVGLVVFLFLPVNPEAMGEAADDYPGLDKLTLPLLTNRIIPKTKDKPVGFIEAWRIPGVAPLLSVCSSPMSLFTFYVHGQKITYFLRPLWESPPKPFQEITHYHHGNISMEKLCRLHGWGIRETPRKVFDAVLFNNEVDLLAIRWHELGPYVSEFVLLESNSTFTGKTKPLLFAESRRRDFQFTEEKLTYGMVAGRFVRGENPFVEESYQRVALDQLIRIAGISDDDLLIMSDVDEIPTS